MQYVRLLPLAFFLLHPFLFGQTEEGDRVRSIRKIDAYLENLRRELLAELDKKWGISENAMEKEKHPQGTPKKEKRKKAEKDVSEWLDEILDDSPQKMTKETNEISELLEEILGQDEPKHFRKAELGLLVMKIPPIIQERENLPNEEGVMVYCVREKSPADKAGIKKWDILLRLDHYKISSPEDLATAISKFKPGDIVRLSLFSSGRRKEVFVSLAPV